MKEEGRDLNEHRKRERRTVVEVRRETAEQLYEKRGRQGKSRMGIGNKGREEVVE